MGDRKQKTKVIKPATSRVEWVDVAKGVGIVLVVLAHAIPKNHVIWQFINQFHMPFFFMVSGYLYSTKNSWVKFVVRKIRTLWLPFVFTSILTRAVSIVIGKTLVGGIKSIVKMFLLLEAGPLLGAIWFIRVLFYAVIVYDLITRVSDKVLKEKSEVGLSVLSVVMIVIGISIQLPAQGSVVLNSIAFIHLGKVLRNHRLIERIHILAAVVAIAMCFAISLINRTSYVGNTYTFPVLFVIAAITGSIGLMALCRCIYRNTLPFRGLLYLGRNSMGLMIWQFVTFKLVIAIQIVFYHLGWNRISDFPVIYEYANLPWVTLDVIAGLYVSILLYKIINQPVDNLSAKAEQWVLTKLRYTHCSETEDSND